MPLLIPIMALVLVILFREPILAIVKVLVYIGIYTFFWSVLVLGAYSLVVFYAY